jgi:integrase
MRLLILTGCRRTEIGDMRFSELKDRPLWRIPETRTKNAHQHELPLPGIAWNIIDSVLKRGDCDYLFGARDHRGFNNWHWAKRALDAKLGDAITQGWTLHDIRRSVATKLAESPDDGGLGLSPHIVEAVLNHVSGHKAGPAGIYNRATYIPEVKTALARWADHVTALAVGAERKIPAYPEAAS